MPGATARMRFVLAMTLGGLLLALPACGPLQPVQGPPTYGNIGGRGGNA